MVRFIEKSNLKPEDNQSFNEHTILLLRQCSSYKPIIRIKDDSSQSKIHFDDWKILLESIKISYQSKNNIPKIYLYKFENIDKNGFSKNEFRKTDFYLFSEKEVIPERNQFLFDANDESNKYEIKINNDNFKKIKKDEFTNLYKKNK